MRYDDGVCGLSLARARARSLSVRETESVWVCVCVCALARRVWELTGVVHGTAKGHYVLPSPCLLCYLRLRIWV